MKLAAVCLVVMLMMFVASPGAQSEWDRSWEADHGEITVHVSKDGTVETQVKLDHVAQDYIYFVKTQNGKYSLKHREIEVLHRQNKWGEHPGMGQSREGALLDYPKSAFSITMKLDEEKGSLASFMFITEGSDGYFIRIVTMFPIKNLHEGEKEL